MKRTYYQNKDLADGFFAMLITAALLFFCMYIVNREMTARGYEYHRGFEKKAVPCGEVK